jgi:hypothetical protein
MSQPSIFFVGSQAEVAHHAAPIAQKANVEIVGAGEIVGKANPGDLAIFFSEHFDRFRDACQTLKSNNVATLYMVDGILEWRNAWVNREDEVACPYAMRPVLAHKVACIGDSQARVLETWGNVGKTEIVGIPRLANYQPRSEYEPQQQDGRQGNSSERPFRVLIMTAKTPGFTLQQIETTQLSLQDLAEWRKNNPTLNGRPVEFTWRITGGLEKAIGVENKLSDLTGLELSQQLAQVDAVITTPSTAMLEAMLLDLPVAVLDYHNCPHYVTAGWDICTQTHIGPALVQMESRSETRMLFQREQLNQSLMCDPNSNSVDRFCELIDRMLKISAHCLGSGLPLNFPSNILATPNELRPRLDHRSIFPDAKEFKDQEATVLQVELSHARREIEHLHRELAQVQSELDQAHQIFEQIEKHPIAGPIVRVRQRMLDLMAAIKKRKTKLDSTSQTHPPRSGAESSTN